MATLTQPKPTALERYLSKSHRSWCKMGLSRLQKERVCTCGRDAALKEYEELKKPKQVQMEMALDTAP